MTALLGLFTSCLVEETLPPRSGIPPHAEKVAFGVRDGAINLANGNLFLERQDLDIDTTLGNLPVFATYNSADGKWHWSFDLAYDGDSFTDPRGGWWSTHGVTRGYEIPGSGWRRYDENELVTRGGLVHEFQNGQLAAVHWDGLEYPRWVFDRALVDGQSHTRIQTCSESACVDAIEVSYDAEDRVVEISDRAGREAQYSYDAEGRLLAARDPYDVEMSWPGTRYEYADAASTRVSAIVSSEDERVEFGYDTVGHVVSYRRVGENDPAHFFSYARFENGPYQTVVSDPDGASSTYRYDSFWKLISRINGVGESVLYTWSGFDLASRTDAAGLVTTWSHENVVDFLGGYVRVVTRNEPSGNQVVTTYAAGAHNNDNPFAYPLLAHEDSLGLIERREYKIYENFLTRIENGAGDWTKIGTHAYAPECYHYYPSDSPWDIGCGWIVSNRNGSVEVESYTESGHVKTISLVGVTGTSSSVHPAPSLYDDVGNLIVGEDKSTPLSPGRPGIVSSAFNANREVASLLLTGNESVQIERRSDGEPVRITRPYGGDTEFDYDELGRAVARRERVDGAFVVTRFEYDSKDRTTAVEMANGMRTEYVYDAAGREIERHHLRWGEVEKSLLITWESGRVVSREDSVHDGPENFEYDFAGRLSAVVYPGGERLENDRDLRGRVTARRFISAQGVVLRTLENTYDAAGREATLVEDGQLLVGHEYGSDWDYESDGWLGLFWKGGVTDRVEYGNGLVRTFGHDAYSGQLMEVGLNGFVHTYIQRQAPCSEGLYRHFDCVIVHKNGSGTGSPEFFQFTTGHTVLGGLQHVYLDRPLWGAQVGGSGYNRYSGIYYASENYGYDALNNRTDSGAVYNAEHNRLLETQSNSYFYDEAGFLVLRQSDPEAEGGAVESVNYVWDAMGRIASMGDDTFAWDSLGRPVSKTLGGATTRYLFGGRVEADAAANPVALDLGSVRIDLVTGGHLYRHYDFRGNVQFVTDDTGAVVRSYTYRAFGLESAEGEAVDARTFAQGEELGDVIRLGVRLYDPEVGRFLSPDPIYQVLNQYSYAEGNPVGLWDPDGRQAHHPAGDIAKVVGKVIQATKVGLKKAGSKGRLVAAAIELAELGISELVDILSQTSGEDTRRNPPPPSPEWQAIYIMSGFMFWNG